LLLLLLVVVQQQHLIGWPLRYTASLLLLLTGRLLQ
jgi:hypothetical protein